MFDTPARGCYFLRNKPFDPMPHVNGEAITDEEVLAEVERLRRAFDWQQLSDVDEREGRLREAAQLSLIDRTLIRQHAERDSAPLAPGLVDAEIARIRKSEEARGRLPGEKTLRVAVERQLRFDRAAREIAGPLPPPASREDVERVYLSQRETLRRPEAVRASHIVRNVDGRRSEADARELIGRALRELESGEPFAEVAARHSDCPGNAGDLGLFPRGQMVDEFDAVVFAMQPGEVSPIFRTPFGYHIAKVVERQESYLPDLEEARPRIEQMLMAMTMQQQMARAIAALRARSTIAGLTRYAPQARVARSAGGSR